MTTIHTATAYIPHPAIAGTKHRTHYTAAMAFVQSHGHFSAITKDGLLCMSWEGNTQAAIAWVEGQRGGTATEDGDGWYEAPMLFDVDADGYVVSREVRNWLGY